MTAAHLPTTRRGLIGGFAGLAATSGAASAQSVPPPRRGGTMTIMFPSEPPVLVSLVSSNSLTVSAKVTEGLLWYDNDMVAHPQLAREWEVSPDGLTYVFKLREGVKWHDGRDFTSEDVAASLAILKQSHPRGRSTFAHLTRVETPDPHTVILKLGTPVPYLIRAFAAAETPIVPKHIYDGTDPFTNRNGYAPVGTGPFRFKEWVRGSHIIYERNPEYWDQPRPYLDQLVVKFIPDAAARSAALESGEVDLGYRTPVALNDVERLRTAGNLVFETKGYEYSNNVVSVNFNLDNPHFAKLPVRQAIAHALNMPVICRTIYYNTYTPCASPIAPFLTEYHDLSPSPYAFDIARAERLLDEAGYPRGANRIRLRTMMEANPTVDEIRRLCDFTRAALSRIGIAVEVRTADFGSYAKRVYTDRDFDLTASTMSNLFDPTVGVQRLYWSKNYIPGVPFSNATHYSNPRVDALLEGTAVEVDPVKRKAMFKEFQEIVMREIPDVNIGVPRWYTIHNRRALGHSVTADGIEGSFSHAYIAG
ncbi:ABC transporter substrate-binding protein [Roseomonas sp. HJA6]|uniref:ABC transporter substrate-binding protein n=1 Tax=Roseomonas alba TaxID=2846776 RepID=A0ABS7A7E3_9PROT|nr:ABC transporter substrate-binding protein [Neoroseomonas alba]MBW6398202.1 ABC transporter substrate-binding protein [Neoroseomonas alba]